MFFFSNQEQTMGNIYILQYVKKEKNNNNIGVIYTKVTDSSSSVVQYSAGEKNILPSKIKYTY